MARRHHPQAAQPARDLSGPEGVAKTVPIPEAERDALAHIRDLDIDVEAMSAVSNVFRVANAFRNHTERHLLSQYGLSFSGFTVLWVLWIWGPRESGELALEAGITKGTLTGVLKTLERLGFAERSPHATDRRRVIVRATPKGSVAFQRMLPRFNTLESAATRDLSGDDKAAMTRALRVILTRLQDDEAHRAE